MTDTTDDEVCGFCWHLVAEHGTTEIGCSECACGMEPDYFHPEPPRADE